MFARAVVLTLVMLSCVCLYAQTQHSAPIASVDDCINHQEPQVLNTISGVDFGPYLDRVRHIVKQNWVADIPEGLRYRKGCLSIEFAILKDGRVAGMRRALSSGNIPMDRAAWEGIRDSDPFPPLPTGFKGQYLALRFYFNYNISVPEHPMGGNSKPETKQTSQDSHRASPFRPPIGVH